MMICHMQNTTLTRRNKKAIYPYGTQVEDYTDAIPKVMSDRTIKVKHTVSHLTRKQAQAILDEIGANSNPGDKVVVKVCNCEAITTDGQNREVDPYKAILATLKINRRNPIRIAVGPGGAELDLMNDISEYPGM